MNLNESGIVIVLRGETSRKTVYENLVVYEAVEVTPFVGQNRCRVFGVGFIYVVEGEERVSCVGGIRVPTLLIQSWRAMKLMEMLDVLHTAHVHDYFSLGTEKLSGDEPRHLREIASLYGGMDKLRDLRAEALSHSPTYQEHDWMRHELKDKGIQLWDHEVMPLMPAATIKTRLLAADVKWDMEHSSRAPTKVLLLTDPLPAEPVPAPLPFTPRWWRDIWKGMN